MDLDLVGEPPAKRRRLAGGGRGAGRATSSVRVVTLCSGIEAVIQAYENLGVPHEHAAACEKDRAARLVLELNFSPQQFFPDVTTLSGKDLPEHDMLWAGFPCQPFSKQGLGQGLDDEAGRGCIILHIVRLVAAKMPRVVVLENVKGMATSTHRPGKPANIQIIVSLGGLRLPPRTPPPKIAREPFI